MENCPLRDQLILLWSEKKIKHKKKFLQEATEETLQKIWREYEAQQLEETNAQLSLVLTTKFTEFMAAMELVKDQYRLENDLTKTTSCKKTLKRL